MSALGGDLSGTRVLDLFAGSGALGLEALSRGATEAVFVEISRAGLRALRANIEALQCAGRARVVHDDALKYVASLPQRAFDVALADPPYGRGFAGTLLDAYTRSPFAEELWVEHRSDEPISGLEGVRQRRYGDTTLTTLTAAVPRKVKP